MPGTSFVELLQLSSSPVAIAFVDAPPPGVPHASSLEPAGCGHWRRAAEGEEDAYFAIPGPHLSAIEDSLAAIVRANHELEKFHRARAAAMATGD